MFRWQGISASIFNDAQLLVCMNMVLCRMWTVHPSKDLYENALKVQSRFRYSFYDSRIVSAALSQGYDFLYTADLQHGHTIENLLMVNPLIADKI